MVKRHVLEASDLAVVKGLVGTPFMKDHDGRVAKIRAVYPDKTQMSVEELVMAVEKELKRKTKPDK
jgi:hypothetical protein